MSTFLTYSVIGISLGAIYAINATGLVVTYNTTGVFNFAHGAVGAIAAFSYWTLWQDWHLPALVALAIVLFVEAPLIGVGIEFGLMRRLHGASTERALMVTLGLLVILIGAATALWNTTTSRTVPAFFSGHTIKIFSVYITWQQIIIVAVAALLAVGLRFFFRRFRVGVAMRAVVDDPELVSMSGAHPHRIAQVGWVMGTFLASLAVCLYAPLVATTGITVRILSLLVVNAYAAAVLGRLRSVPRTFLGGILLGLVTEYCFAYLPTPPFGLSQTIVKAIPEAVPALILFVLLLVIPGTRLVAVGRLPVHLPPAVPSARRSLLLAVIFVAVIAALSPVLVGTAIGPVTQGIALGIVGLSLVLLTGYAGQVSLCQLTFLGVGAFAMGKLAGGGTWWGALAAVAICGALGALVSLPALRLRGLYLALATLAFGEAAYYVFFTNSSVFPGYGGVVTVRRLGFFGMHSIGDKAMLIETAVAFSLCAILVLAIRRSRFGRRLVALNDSPAAFATLGMGARTTKMAVFAVSAALAGLGGVLYGGEARGITANDVVFFSSLILLLFVAIWGMRTITGALMGGLTVAVLPFVESHYLGAIKYLPELVAGVGIFLLARNPDGLVGTITTFLRWTVSRDRSDAPGLPDGSGSPVIVGADGA